MKSSKGRTRRIISLSEQDVSFSSVHILHFDSSILPAVLAMPMTQMMLYQLYTSQQWAILETLSCN